MQRLGVSTVVGRSLLVPSADTPEWELIGTEPPNTREAIYMDVGTTNTVPGISKRPRPPRKQKSASESSDAKPQLSQILENHVSHIKGHLARVKKGLATIDDPERVYLGHTEGDCFWEVVGLRMVGHPLTVLAALPFRRQQIPGIGHARESLAAYLTFPPATVATDGSTPRMGVLNAFLPRTHETIPEFLKGLRAGRVNAPTQIDPDQIEAAFDLRMHNPSALDTLKQTAGPLRQFMFRTARGHVLTGLSHGLGQSRQREQRFVPLCQAEQHTAKGKIPLGTVILRNRFLSLATDVTDSPARMAAANWVPFVPQSASGKNLLLG